MKLLQTENEWSQEDEEVNGQHREKKIKICKAATGAVEHFGYFQTSIEAKGVALFEMLYINTLENQSGESTGEECVVNFILLINLQMRLWLWLSPMGTKGLLIWV